MLTDAQGRLTSALAGRYTIERELGAGGMATVYLAHDVRHDRKVALKLLRPELAAILGGERFLKEIRLTANLQHPHILGLHDSGEADGLVYYVMPYVEGESLRERLTREHQLPIEETVRIATEVAGALDYAHRHGVIHRDIKPENILLHDGSALVADFGIALAASRSDSGTRLTETGMSLGTPHYMSPEQAMGEREITAKSDVYALGCVVYEMLSGEPPFTGPTAQAIVARVMTEQPRSLTLQRHSVPPHVEAAVNQALEKLPADRFATAAHFAEALAHPELTAARTVPTVVQTRMSDPWRRRFGVALGIGVVLAVLAAWGWLRTSRAVTTRQYVTLGDSIRLSTQFPSMALSPDGSLFVFKEDRQNGRLWIKRRGDLTMTPLTGTERAQYPFFSPDGQWIGFTADSRLKKVPINGGTTVTVADSVSAGFGGATWLDDGSIVYVPTNLLELRQVSADGGPTKLVLASKDVSIIGGGTGNPVGLPGSHAVLFQLCASSCVTMSVHVLDLRTGKEKTLVDEAAEAWYLPDGRLFYVRRDGVGFVAPFDLDKLEITRTAVPVLDGVAVSASFGFAQLAWSRSGTLVYERTTGAGATENVIVRVGRDGSVVPVDTAWVGEFNSIALSPDGRRLAVSSGLGTAVSVWIKQLDRGPFTRLSFTGPDRRPFWSPDGRTVAFIRDSGGSSAVYARPADGSGEDQLLVRIDRLVQEGAWSADNRWILVRTDNAQAGAGDILAVPRRGGAPVPVAATAFTELNPALSPDSRWLAYTSDESGINEVYVRPFPNATAGRWQVSNGGGTEPRWSHDGHTLFYLDGAAHLDAVSVQSAPTFAIGQRTALFDASNFVLAGFHQSYDLTPDGRAFLFVSPRRAGATGAPQLVWIDNWLADLAVHRDR
ncbi:MAG TPA: protein kinase [Gemmatimonadales bacterium]